MLQTGPVCSRQPLCQLRCCSLRMLFSLLNGLAATTTQHSRAQPPPCASYDASDAASALSVRVLAPTGYQLASAPQGPSASHLTRRYSYHWPADFRHQPTTAYLPLLTRRYSNHWPADYRHQPTTAYQLLQRPSQPRCQAQRRHRMGRRTRRSAMYRHPRVSRSTRRRVVRRHSRVQPQQERTEQRKALLLLLPRQQLWFPKRLKRPQIRLRYLPRFPEQQLTPQQMRYHAASVATTTPL